MVIKADKARVDRGGCWLNRDPSGLRGTDRNWHEPSGRGAVISFRPVLDVPRSR